MPRKGSASKVCTVAWCHKPATGRFCPAHWSMKHKYGTPTPPELAHNGSGGRYRIRLLAKTCTHCGELKDASKFQNNGKAHSWCRPCVTRKSNVLRAGQPYSARSAKRFYDNVQTETLRKANNKGKRWTPEEEATVMRPDMTMTEKAFVLGRTYKAIDDRIYIIHLREEKNGSVRHSNV